MSNDAPRPSPEFRRRARPGRLAINDDSDSTGPLAPGASSQSRPDEQSDHPTDQDHADDDSGDHHGDACGGMESGWPRWLLGAAVVPADPGLRRAVATPQVPRPLSSWLPAGSAGRRIVTVVTIAVCLQRLSVAVGLRMFDRSEPELDARRIGLMAETTGDTSGIERVERELTPAEAQWWLRKAESLRMRQPVASWVSCLIDQAADTPVACPLCPQRGGAAAILDHVLGDHGASFSQAATWLETVDADLFSLAVNYLMSKDRSARTA